MSSYSPRKRYRTEGIAIRSSDESNVNPPTIVIKPKLRAPSPHPEQVVRPRVLELLGEAWHRKVSLITAPAGYGKTTLLIQWCQAEDAGLPFAWVSLDEQDRDLVRMWRHIVEAVRQVVPEEEDFGSDVLVSLNAVGQSSVPKGLVEIVLPMLINELNALSYQVIVVLDDYQFVTEETSQECMTFFVEHLPDNVHLVLASRSDPPLPLGRLRARGEMNEIRTEQLAFSEEEATSLLNEKMGLEIGSGDISVLLERTEGWPAAIYLAALSMHNREDKHAFIESFRGSNRYIVDLLGEEVLAGLSEEVREFLLETSVLRRMTGSLCDAVAERENSSQLLRELARSNLFVVPLDEQGEWYRYHHLFADLLLYELKSRRPDLVPVLHVRASVWSEDAGFIEGAIRQAIAAEDYGRGALLIARYWYGYAVSGQIATVERWLDSLPEGLATQDAALVLVKTWICALSGRREEAETLLALAEGLPHEGPLPDGTASVEAGVASIQASFGYDGVLNALEAARRAAALDPELTSPRAALISFGLGAGLYLSGETSLARKQLEKTLQLTEAGQPLVRMISLSFLSIVATDEGHLEEAESLAREARQLVERFKLQGIPQSSWVPIALGCMLARRGDLDEAQTELESGLSVRRKLSGLSPWPTIIGLLALAQVRSARGDRAGGRAVLAEARTILEGFPDAGMLSERLEREERKLRARKPRQGQLDGELTARELEVLRLLNSEFSTRQIAQSRYVAPSTVRTQLKSIYRKLGVSSRKEAVEEARAKGLI